MRSPLPQSADIQAAATKAADILFTEGVLERVTGNDLHDLVSAISVHRLAAGEYLFEEGDIGDALYVILEGEAVVSCSDGAGTRNKLGTLAAGAICGEQSLLDNEPGSRSASIMATSELRCARLALPEFQLYTRRTGRELLAGRGAAQAVQRLQTASPIFRRIAFGAFESRLEVMRVAAGKTLFRENDASAHAFIVANGRIAIRRDNGRMQIAELGIGMIFGEVGVLEGTPRTGSAIALADCVLLVVPWAIFRRLHANCVELQQTTDALWRFYALAGGRPLTLSEDMIDSQPAIAARFLADDGRPATARKTLGRPFFSLRIDAATPGRVLTWKGISESRELLLERDRIVQIESLGHWDALGEASARLLSGEPLSKTSIETFSRTGSFL